MLTGMRSERTRTPPSAAETAGWGLVSSVAAPVLLIGGFTVAAGLQPGDFDQARETISALAAHGAENRLVMTTALVGLGVSHVVTALALRPVATAGRVMLAVGGAATVCVAAFPLPADDSGSAAHTAAALVSFLALAAWPAAHAVQSELVWVPDPASQPAVLRPVVCAAAAAVLLGLVGWFGAELAGDTDQVGLSERVAAGAQALWPLAVVVGSRRWRR